MFKLLPNLQSLGCFFMLITRPEHQSKTLFHKHSTPKCMWLRVAKCNAAKPKTHVIVVTITFKGKLPICPIGI